MDNALMLNIFDTVLIIVGIVALLKVFIKLFIPKSTWEKEIDVYVIDDDGDSRLEKYKACRNYEQNNSDIIEITVIAPINFTLDYIKVYDVKIGKKIKKGKLLYKHKRIMPNEAILIYENYGCACPTRIIKIANSEGGIATIPLHMTGFNSNRQYVSVEFKYSIFNKLINIILK